MWIQDLSNAISAVDVKTEQFGLLQAPRAERAPFALNGMIENLCIGYVSPPTCPPPSGYMNPDESGYCAAPPRPISFRPEISL